MKLIIKVTHHSVTLCLFFKIVNGLSPPHLSKLLDTYLINNQRYEFRPPNIPIPRARTETYRCSFFPSAIRSWNYLHQSIKNANSIDEFKRKLSKPRKINAYYSMGSRCINSILNIRMCCSHGDASDAATGVVLLIEDSSGIDHTIRYFSGKFDKLREIIPL